LDTVLGLALTSTAAGWVLVEGRDAEGAIVQHGDLTVRTGGGAHAARAAQQVAAAVLHARAQAARHPWRVRVIGLTWGDDAATEAALLLESLTAAGLDNVVPVHALQAAELLTPEFTQSRSAVALAHGAARASVRHPGFTDPEFVESIDSGVVASAPARARGYAGAMTMLAAGAILFVASLSLAVGYRLLPDRPSAPVEQAAHRWTSRPAVADVVTPASPPPALAAPPPQPAPEPALPAEPVPVDPLRGVADEPPIDPPAAEPELPPPPDAAPPAPNPQPLLTRLLERLRGEQRDPDPDGPGAPADPGAPSP